MGDTMTAVIVSTAVAVAAASFSVQHAQAAEFCDMIATTARLEAKIRDQGHTLAEAHRIADSTYSGPGLVIAKQLADDAYSNPNLSPEEFGRRVKLACMAAKESK
ncbi:hypothetical protein [Burkholderia phage BCSR129]|nr:hypothetical protein [Burkholderia phage BCSR129]